MTHHDKLCFVISPIGDPDSETRKRSDQVLKHVVRPAATTCGYNAVRADEIDKPGMITSQVIQHVVNDALVVADLTERNPNVFYELAIRHALRKPLVQIIKKGEAIPFDVAGTRTIYVDHKDLDSVEAAKNEIIEQIKALEKDSSDIETPISVSLDLQLLRQSEKPEERSLADLVAAVVDLRASLTKVELRIGTKDQEGLLGEIQSELRALPSRLDDYLGVSRLPGMRRGRFHPMMLREMLHMGPQSSGGFGVLILASLFRDSMPWLYEMGVEVFRLSKQGTSTELREAVQDFRNAVEVSFHSPMGHEFLNRSKDMFMIMEEIEPLLDRTLGMLGDESTSGRRRPKRDTEEST
jgi:hypothetical protein